MNRLTACGALVAALLLGACATARTAGPPISASRPGLGEGTQTVGAGALNLEGGYSVAHAGEENDHAVGELLVRYGIGESAELRLGINSYALSRSAGAHASGLQDSWVGFKGRVAAGGGSRWAPSAAVVLGTTLPTGTGGMGADAPQPGGKLALAWEVTDRLGLLSNLGYDYTSDAGERAGRVSAIASTGWALTPRSGSYLEYAASRTGGATPATGHEVAGGFSHLVTDDLQVDLWAGRSLGGDRPRYSFGVGFARRW